MARYGILVDYEWCSGCHTCEVACQMEHGLPTDRFGAKLFELGKKYTEAETREMLAAVYEDYSMLRRYLVDYGFMGRTKDGTEYWLK